ncbi:MAG: hypothetical protein MJZ81_10080 [Bacteroidales bacterium]|nr:hypothetical protein [Bacteroidales bacterium]
MQTLLAVLACALVIIGLSFAGIAIKILVKKNGEFKRHCSSVDPYTGERSGCVCGKTVYDNCKTAPNYHPLEVNRELLNEIKGK